VPISEKIVVGTSGYSYYDWKCVFYPADIKSSEMLAFYCTKFNGLEINSSFYRLHTYRFYKNLDEKTPDYFQFIVKIFRDITHKRREIDEALRKSKQAVEPLIAKGKFGGFLAQFPPSFSFSQINLDYIKNVKEALVDLPLFIEFRNPSWCREETYISFQKNDISYVCVDGPKLPELMPRQDIVTTKFAYVRFHGRDKEAWMKPPMGKKYNYNYSYEELIECKDKIEKMLDKCNKIFIFFNNGINGYAPKNALQLMEMLGLKSESCCN